jgi:hypothetical protein
MVKKNVNFICGPKNINQRRRLNMKWKTDDGGWSPYLAGALLGFFGWG